MVKLPLEGVRVVEITVVWAGPYGTQPLSDWGAEVIRVESRQHFQFGTRCQLPNPSPSYFKRSGGGNLIAAVPNRTPGEHWWNQNPSFNGQARNKLSMTVDVTRPEGLDVFKRLIKVSDIFVENNAYGTLAKYGISYDSLKDEKPDIIYIALPPFGSTGPYRDYRTFGFQLDGFAGHYSIMSYPGEDPTHHPATVHCDGTGAACTTFAALAALYHRKKTGKGQFIDMAQVETESAQFGESIMDYTMNGRVQGTLGNRHPAALQGCYRCRGNDAWVNITINNDAEWAGFVRALNNPTWTQLAIFGSHLNRYAHHNEMDQFIGEWTASRDKYAVMHTLQKEGVPAGPVMTERDCLNDPHLEARGFFEKVTHPDCGTHHYPGLIWKMSKTPNHIHTPACRLGEHNDYVYRKVIGVSDAEFAALEKGGHIGTDYAPGVAYIAKE